MIEARHFGWFLSTAVALVLGCGETVKTAPSEISLRKLASYYGMYVSTHKGQSPATENDLRGFIEQKSPGTDVDALFRSARDGEPYVFVFSPSSKAGPGQVIGHEKTGLAGKRFVAFGTTEVRELDESEFKLAISKR